LALASQRFDIVAGRLAAALSRNREVHAQAFTRTSARFGPSLLERPRLLKAQRLGEVSRRFMLAARRGPERVAETARLPALGQRLDSALGRRLKGAQDRLAQLEKLRRSLDPNRPLTQGFALVCRPDGAIVRRGAELRAGEAVSLRFADIRRGAVIEGGEPAETRARSATKPPVAGQGDLF
jgi:exodeoxyribonuclease VII large subunit